MKYDQLKISPIGEPKVDRQLNLIQKNFDNLQYGLNAITYNDLPPTPITSARLGSTAPTLTTFKGNIEQYTFDATNDYVIGATEITHSYQEGSDIEAHIHWATNGTNATVRGVKWQLEYSICDGDGKAPFSHAFPTSTTVSSDVLLPIDTVDRAHIITTLGTIDGTNIKIGAYIVWRLNRIASAYTAPANDPFALAVGFHIQQDNTGSMRRYQK